MADAQMRIFRVLDATSRVVTCARLGLCDGTPGPVVVEYQHETAEAAWLQRIADARVCGVHLAPSEHVVVPFVATGGVDSRGVPLFAPEWSGMSEVPDA